MRRILLLVFIASMTLAAVGQSTTISSSGVVDSDGFTWKNGTYQVQFVPNPSWPSISTYVWAGGNLQQNALFTGSLDSSGEFSVSIPSNTSITPSGSQWKVTVCPNAQTGCFSINTGTVTGATQDLTSAINASAQGPRFPITNYTGYGYGTVEVNPTPLPGTEFYDTTNATCYQFSGPPGNSWAQCPNGIGVYVPLAGGTMTGALTNSSGFIGPLTGIASQNLPLAGGTMGNNAAISFQGTGAAATLANLGGLPLAGGTLTGPLTTAALNHQYVVSSTSDLGTQINTALGNGYTSIFIPDGVAYTWAVGISDTLTSSQVYIACGSRNDPIYFTGSGDAVYYSTAGGAAASLTIYNCNLHGENASSGNLIHAFHAQNLRLLNDYLYGAKAINLYGQGLISGLVISTDIVGAGTWNYELAPDTTDNFGSNANHMYGGSLQYGGSGNFWDAGNSSGYGGDTGNTLDGVVMELSANVPQFIVEGTWNDAIKNSYLEYINFGTSTGNLYSGLIGNYSGSGYGQAVNLTAVGFEFNGNYMITPRAGSGFTTASLFLANTGGVILNADTDVGAPSYFAYFYASGTNVGVYSSALSIGWIDGLYLNTPAGNWLMQGGGQPVATGQYQLNSTGVTIGGTINGLSASSAQPATCSVGELWANSSATSLSTLLYACYPANTWNAVTIP